MVTCHECKFWSTLMAIGKGGHVYAMCLNEKSIKYQKYTIMGCKKFKAGPPIDEEVKGGAVDAGFRS